MEYSYHVRVVYFSNLLEIEGSRTGADYAALLDAMEYGDQSGMDDGESREMCILSLQDLGPEEAAYVVLKHDFKDVLRDGQARNLAGEMLEEKLWEEYADSALHERMFNAGSLLYSVFPHSFPKPDAVRVTLDVTAADLQAKALLTPMPHESLLVRLLADGMDEHAVLHRLYGDELKGSSFPNAAEVVWIVSAEAIGEDAVSIDVTSSGYWLDALIETESYGSNAYADQI